MSESQDVKNIPSITDIEKTAGSKYSAQAAYGFVSGLSDDAVLGLTARFVQNRTLSGKQSKISGCRLRIGSARTANPGHFPSKILFQKRNQRQAS
jgi:hypothetical protein